MVTLVFDIINPDIYILQISELIAFEYQTLCKIGEMIYFINQCGDPYVSMDKKKSAGKTNRLIFARNQFFVCEIFQAYTVLHEVVQQPLYHYKTEFPKEVDVYWVHPRQRLDKTICHPES